MASAGEDVQTSEFGELILAERNLESLPTTVAQKCGGRTTLLNLTDNCLQSAENLHLFTRLETLILDKNGLDSLDWCCPVPTLKTLYFNNNCVSDLPKFLASVSKLFPELEYLSMMRNPCCPAFWNIKKNEQREYRRHREFVISQLPQLVFLDATPVSDEEREVAMRRGKFLGKRAKPTPKKRSVEAGAATAKHKQYAEKVS